MGFPMIRPYVCGAPASLPKSCWGAWWKRGSWGGLGKATGLESQGLELALALLLTLTPSGLSLPSLIIIIVGGLSTFQEPFRLPRALRSPVYK